MSPERTPSGSNEIVPASPTGSKTEKMLFGEQVLLCLKQLEEQTRLTLRAIDNLVVPLLTLIERVQEVRDQAREGVVFDRAKKQEEEKALPLLRINKGERRAEIDGKVLRFRKKDALTFKLLVFFAENPRRDIKTREIKEKVFPEINLCYGS